MPSAPGAGASPLRQRSFVLFLLSRILSQGAIQVQTVAVGWQMYELSDSALDLGLLGLAGFLPILLLTLPAGHVADAYPRVIVVGLCRLALGGVVLVLGIGTLAGWMGREAIFALVATLGVARAFEMPAQQALLPGVVPAALFPRAVSLSTTCNQLATIGGPALSGSLVAVGGAAAAYLPAAVALLVSAVLAFLIAAPRQARVTGVGGAARFFEGVTFLRTRPVLLGAISLDMVAVLLGAVVALYPVYARDILLTGPWGLGLLRAAPAVGAMGMGLLLAWRPLGAGSGRRMFAAVIVFGVAITIFALSTSLVLSLAILVAAGAADVVSVVVRQSLVQLGTPDEMRGRVAAVNALFIGASNQLGDLRAGAAAEAFGPVVAAALGGVCTVAVAVVWMRLFPGLRAVERLEDVSG